MFLMWLLAFLIPLIGLGECLIAYDAQVSTNTDSIHLRSSVTCGYSKETRSDLELGEVFWHRLDSDSCKSNLHRVLYEGPANIIKPSGKSLSDAIVSVKSDNVLFSLQLVKPYQICNLDSWTTEHPKLVIIRKTGAGFYYRKSLKVDSAGLDMFTYMNSKFVYLERNIGNNFNELWDRFKASRCEMEKTILQSQLSLAKLDPQEFAFSYIKSQGYTAVTIGEVTYITKCQAVGVIYRKSENCYNELPVVYKNASFFMTPKTHLLQKHGNQIECSPLMSPHYMLEGRWWSSDKILRESSAPTQLTSTELEDLKFTTTENLATAGIYSQDDLDLLRDHLMFGSEREALVTVLSRGYDGKETDFQGGSLLNMMSEEQLESFGKKLWSSIWNGVSTFGNISAGIIGFMMIIKIIKWLIDTIIHRRTLYELYGFSCYLLGSLWDALTLYLIHKAPNKEGSSEASEEEHNSGKKNIVLSNASKNFAQKLAPRYVLCTVHKKKSKLVYVLKNEDGSNAGQWHIQDLKPYNGSLSESDFNEGSIADNNSVDSES